MDLGAQDAGIVTPTWDGKDDSGNAMPDGKYTFTRGGDRRERQCRRRPRR